MFCPKCFVEHYTINHIIFFFGIEVKPTSFFWHSGEPRRENKCVILQKVNGSYGWTSELCSASHEAICSSGRYFVTFALTIVVAKSYVYLIK